MLFLILIAVALFAALSYAVTKSSRSGAPDLREKDTLNVARILDFTSHVRVAVQRLKVMNGGAITDLLFDNDVYTRADGTTLLFNAMGNPADPRRYVFHARGGGVAPQTLEDLAAPCSSCSTSNTKSGHVALVWINIPVVGTDTSDPALFLSSLNKGTCAAIDKKLGLAGIPTLAVVFHATFCRHDLAARCDSQVWPRNCSRYGKKRILLSGKCQPFPLHLCINHRAKLELVGNAMPLCRRFL